MPGEPGRLRIVERLLLALAIVVVAAVVALVARRRRVPDAPTQTAHEVPDQLDRRDFADLIDSVAPESRDAEWLLVVFTSATCHTCADMAVKAKAVASRHVAVVEVEYAAQRELHQRYRIDAVPTTVLADADGVVRASFLGRVERHRSVGRGGRGP